MAIFNSIIDPSVESSEYFVHIDSNGGQVGRIRWTNQRSYSFGSFDFTKHWKTVQFLTEQQLRKFSPDWSQSLSQLKELISSLVDAHHDYGSCVYAMSIAAEAAFNYVANELGVTGFQASCADLDIIRRTRRIKTSFTIVTPDNYLYPQYAGKHEELREKMEEEAAAIALKEIRTYMGKIEEETTLSSSRLPDDCFVSPEVAAHWVTLISKYHKEDHEYREAVMLAVIFHQKCLTASLARHPRRT